MLKLLHENLIQKKLKKKPRINRGSILCYLYFNYIHNDPLPMANGKPGICIFVFMTQM